MPRLIMIAFLAGIISGCIRTTTHLQPINTTVQPTLKGKDCTEFILGLSFGTNTIEAAMTHAAPANAYDFHGTDTIRTVRSVSLVDTQFLMFGNRCLEVLGEP